MNPAFQDSTDTETEGLFEELIRAQFPGISSDIAEYFRQILIYDGSQGHTDTVGRISEYIGDAILKNAANAISRAYGTSSYGYEYSTGPAIHADDVPYTRTIFNGPSNLVPTPERAVELQECLISFAIRGVPSWKCASEFPMYGVVTDSTANKRIPGGRRCYVTFNSIPTT